MERRDQVLIGFFAGARCFHFFNQVVINERTFL